MNWLRLERVPAHRLSYLEFGDPANENVIVCAHGLTRNAYDFCKIASELSREFRVVALTYPGRGNSDYFANRALYNYPVYAKETQLFLQKLGIVKPIWLGTSMGGLIGMALASRHSDIFKALILNDIGPFMPGQTLARIRKYASQMHLFDDIKAAKQHLKMIYSQFGITEEADWDHMTKYSFTQNKQGQYQMNYDPNIVERNPKGSNKDVDIWTLWHKIQCSIMLVHGKKSDILLQETVDLMQTTKNIDLYKVEYAGHAPSLMTHDQINAIRSFAMKIVENGR